jgi:hypothetical protein
MTPPAAPRHPPQIRNKIDVAIGISDSNLGRVGVESAKNQGATLMSGTRGALWLPSYLRRDATALGLLLLSI